MGMDLIGIFESEFDYSGETNKTLLWEIICWNNDFDPDTSCFWEDYEEWYVENEIDKLGYIEDLVV